MVGQSSSADSTCACKVGRQVPSYIVAEGGWGRRGQSCVYTVVSPKRSKRGQSVGLLQCCTAGPVQQRRMWINISFLPRR